MNESRIFGAFVLLGLLGYTSALQCYVCNSHFNKDCNDSPVPERYLVSCNSSTHVPLEPSSNEHSQNRQVRVSTAEGVNFTFCRKVVTKIPKQDNGILVMPETTRILRTCGYVQKDKNQCKWANNHGVQMFMCECDKNACNSAPVTLVPAIIYVVIVSLTAILSK